MQSEGGGTMMGGMVGGLFGFGWLLMVLFWLLVIVLAVWLVARLFPQVTTVGESSALQQMGTALQPENETPLEILKKRYARGEITREEYELMRRDLES